MGSVLDEQWREFFSCDAIGSEWLLIRAYKRIGSRSANTRRDDNVLTNGSILSVADGQCVLVVKQGKVIDVCAEPGEHVFEDPEQGGVKGFFREVGKRVAFGGGDIQPTVYRVYYLNVMEIPGIPFRTPAPVPFRVGDPNSGLDLDSGLILGGSYSYRVSDPVKLYKTVIGNVSGKFSRRELSRHMQAELMGCMQSALSALAGRGLRPNELTEHVPALEEALREQMNAGWCGEHGIELGSLALDTCVLTDAGTVQSSQHAAMLRDEGMAGAIMTQAVSEALPAAASAPGARVVPLAAIPVSAPAGARTLPDSPAARTVPPAAERRTPADRPAARTDPAPAARPAPRSPWKCACGTVSDRRFCPNCGKPRPAEWTCACGQKNESRFCSACGARRPE